MRLHRIVSQLPFNCQLLTAYCLLAIFISCKPKADYTVEISRLDSTQVALSSSEERVSNIKLDSSTIDLLSNSMAELTKNMPSDTVDKNTGIFLSELSEVKRDLGNLFENRTNFFRASEESLARIKNLKHDLEGNLIEDSNKAREYVVTEVNASKQIIQGLDQITEKTKATLSAFDSLKVKVTLMTDSLKTK